ncbi:MAG: hypothetical protein KC503_33025, partial [Myxococcales bacterium]|nr:hypothetical protein [Myxococcales bacterium]
GAPLRVVSPQVPGLRLDARGCACFDFAGRGARFEQLRVGLPGAFQAQNATLALAAYEELLEGGVIDVPLEERAVRVALASARLPGRAEHIGRELSGRCDVLLDGAHNADKIAALASTLEATGAQLHLVTGALSGRAVADALAPLARRARTVVASEPRVYAKPAQPAAELAAALAAHHDGRVFAERDASRALDLALDRAGADDLVVVTGSLYLVGALRDRFYPWQRVLIERTSWPATRAAS